jgi:hypothetical protein
MKNVNYTNNTMKTIKIKVYEFDELSAEAKNMALWD